MINFQVKATWPLCFCSTLYQPFRFSGAVIQVHSLFSTHLGYALTVRRRVIFVILWAQTKCCSVQFTSCFWVRELFQIGM